MRSLPQLLSAGLLLLTPIVGRAVTFQTLAQRLPPSTDTLIAINVEKVLDSPYAKQQQWRATMAENWAKRPAVVLPGVKKLLMGAEFYPSKADSLWEISLMELDHMPALKDLCNAEGGYIDRVWNTDAVASPINAYFIPLDPTIMAVATPAERVRVARWVRQPVTEKGAVTSAYTNAVIAGLNDKTDVVMAMDLEGAFGLPNVRRFLGNAELEELKGKNLDTLAQKIASLKGLALSINVTDGISGSLSINFGQDVADLDALAKPLLIAVLNVAGMHLDDVDQWKFQASGKNVTATGKLGDESFRRLIGIVQSPVPAVVAAAAGGGAGAASTQPADPATASQRYFKSVSMMIDNLKTGTSVKETATWWLQASKRIDKLPILNVDPALVDWGTFVSSKLKQLAGAGAAGQTQIQVRVAGVADPEYNLYDTEHYIYNGQERADAENHKRQQREAALQQKGAIQQEAVQILSETNGSRQKVRAEMTTKYNVEF
jgi:hypothetical protein